jgi:hypothetical protein
MVDLVVGEVVDLVGEEQPVVEAAPTESDVAGFPVQRRRAE